MKFAKILCLSFYSFPTKAAKRGPTSLLERQIEQISQLPRTKQKFVSEMLDTVIQQASG